MGLGWRRFQDLEVELDTAAIREGLQNTAENGDVANQLTSILLSSTNTRERRANQAMGLAKQILERDRKLTAMQTKLLETEQAHTGATKRIKQLEFEVASINKPSRYVLEELERRGEEVDRLTAELDSAYRHIRDLNAKVDGLERERRDTEKELALLSRQRGELADLRQIILTLKEEAASHRQQRNAPPSPPTRLQLQSTSASSGAGTPSPHTRHRGSSGGGGGSGSGAFPAASSPSWYQKGPPASSSPPHGVQAR